MCASLGIGACGDDDGPPGIPTGDTGPIDARTDRGRDTGGDDDDGGGEDASDSGGDGSVPAGCSREGGVIDVTRDEMGGRVTIAVGGGSTQFLLAYEKEGAVFARTADFAGVLGTEERVSTSGVTVATDPVIARAGDGWLIAWAEGVSDAGLDVFVRTVSASVELGTPHQITDDAVSDAEPAIAVNDGGALLAWMRDGAAVVRELSSNGEPVGTQQTIADQALGVSVAGLGGGYRVAYVSGGDAPNAWIRRTESDGAPTGEAEQASLSDDAYGGVSVAASEGHGAIVVYDIASSATRRDIRSRIFLESGAAVGSERLLSTGGVPGQAPAVVPFIGGYAAAWRAGPLGVRHVRLALLAPEGDPQEQTEIVLLREQEGSVGVATADDGTLITVWSDRIEGVSIAQLAIARCNG